MRVLLVNDDARPTGGAELTTLALAEGLRGRGHQVRVLAARRRGDEPGFADVTVAGARGERVRTVSRTANPLAALGVRRELARWVPDVVHVRMVLQQLSPLVLPLLRDVPAVYHATMYEAVCPTGLKLLPDGRVCRDPAGRACRGNGCLSPQAAAALLAQRRLWLRWRDAFDLQVANSAATRARLVEDGVPEDRVRVVHNGVPDRGRRPPIDGPPTVAFASRLVPEKGTDVLVRAVARLAPAVPDVRLLVAGDGPDRGRLAALAAAEGVADRVVFLGHVPREALDAAFAGAWVQAVPSRWDEPFGLVAAEAAMRGTAVVASGTGGLAEVVVPGRTGLLAPPGDVAALVDALAAVLGDRRRAEAMGAAGRADAEARFGMDRFVERVEAVYDEARVRRAARPPQPAGEAGPAGAAGPAAGWVGP